MNAELACMIGFVAGAIIAYIPQRMIIRSLEKRLNQMIRSRNEQLLAERMQQIDKLMDGRE